MTMPSDIDIYRTAKIFIDQHGDAALMQAMNRIESYRAHNNQNGMHVWERIANAIEWMQMPPNLTGDTMQ